MSHTSVNLFLESLSASSRQHLIGEAQPVALPQKTILHEPQERSRYAYFLTSGVCSCVTITGEGHSAEVGIIGNEGVVGALLVLGPAQLATQGIMQVQGAGYKIPLSLVRRVFDSNEEIRKRLLEYIQSEALSANLIAGCHRTHGAEQRLARWLLMMRDRVRDNNLHMTQAFIGTLLGAQRPTVTLVSQSLQKRRLLQLQRGQITISDPVKLEATACECYPAIRQYYTGLFQLPYDKL